LSRSYHHSAEIADAVHRIFTSRDVETDRVQRKPGRGCSARGDDFAGGVIEADVVRARSRHVATFDRDFARLPGPERAVLLGSDGGGESDRR
jgi:hypothetical protein